MTILSFGIKSQPMVDTFKNNTELPVVDIFKEGTALCEMRLKDNFLELANTKGFCFASFVSRTILQDIFISHGSTKILLDHREHVTKKTIWAEVSCEQGTKDKKYRATLVWLTLDDVIKATKKKHISATAKSIEKIDSSTKLYRHKKAKLDNYVKNTHGGDSFLSEEKQRQLELRLSQEGDPDNDWLKHEVLAYTNAEYLVEMWAKEYKFDFYDYNSTNQFSPQDCSINNIDIDVKSVVSVGRRAGTQYGTAADQGEVLVGVQTYSSRLKANSMSLRIDGVFDPKRYKSIDMQLQYLTIDSEPNVCYFSSLFDYFCDESVENLDDIAISETVFQYLIDHRLLGIFLKQRETTVQESLLTKLISKQNLEIKTILLELLSQDRLELFVHYLADYIICKTVNKVAIDTENIKQVLIAIDKYSDRKRKFILDLLRANASLEKVRCHWHQEETIKDMGVDIYYRNTSCIPTLKAVCGRDKTKKLKTTFFTYSWKTNETLSYQNDGDICDQDQCGCLLHSYDTRNDDLGVVELGKAACLKYGKKPYMQWRKDKRYPHRQH